MQIQPDKNPKQFELFLDQNYCWKLNYFPFAALENGGLNSQLMMNPFTLMGGLGGAGLNPFAGLPGSMGAGGAGGGGGGMTPAMLSNLYMQGGFQRRMPGMMEQVPVPGSCYVWSAEIILQRLRTALLEVVKMEAGGGGGGENYRMTKQLNIK